MKSLFLTLALFTGTTAYAAPLEGSMEVRDEVLKMIDHEHRQCDRSNHTSLYLEEENTDFSREEIATRFHERDSQCEAEAKRRVENFEKGRINAANTATADGEMPYYEDILKKLDANEEE